jgi:hypothetical protein
MSAQNPTGFGEDPWAVEMGEWFVPVPTCECPQRAVKDGCCETWCPTWKHYRDRPDRSTPDVLGAARRGR